MARRLPHAQRQETHTADFDLETETLPIKETQFDRPIESPLAVLSPPRSLRFTPARKLDHGQSHTRVLSGSGMRFGCASPKRSESPPKRPEETTATKRYTAVASRARSGAAI